MNPFGRTLTLTLVSLVSAACGASGTNPSSSLERDGGPPQDAQMPDGWKLRAADYLERRTAAWLASPPPISNVACAMTCHTTFPYVLARHAFAPLAMPKSEEARTQVVARIAEGAAAKPFYGGSGSVKERESWATEAVLNAAALGMSDMKGSAASLSEPSKAAYARLWSTQNSQGTWDWLEFGLNPWETRLGLDWGAAMTVMVAKVSAQTSAPGYAKSVMYLQDRLTQTKSPMTLHDKTVLLWARSEERSLLTDAQTSAVTAELVRVQLRDGGFSLGTMLPGAIAGSRSTQSDGYGTAIALLALCSQEGFKEHAEVKSALSWFAQNQQADGSWPGRSINKDNALNNSFMTDAATAYGVLAVYTCTP
jgi:squalene-hopene/tetraprenyl-beta-curcumene cyclase